MKKINALLREYEDIEQDFFEIDEEKREARVCMHYEQPSNIFDNKYSSKTPLLSDDFVSSVEAVFKIIPERYRNALEISFDDLEHYTPEQLNEIIDKDLMLNARTMAEALRKRDLLAICLSVSGLVSFFSIMLVKHTWTADTFWHNALLYLLDIATTVLFWEAVNILLLENWSHRRAVLAFTERFSSISFECCRQ